MYTVRKSFQAPHNTPEQNPRSPLYNRVNVTVLGLIHTHTQTQYWFFGSIFLSAIRFLLKRYSKGMCGERKINKAAAEEQVKSITKRHEKRMPETFSNAALQKRDLGCHTGESLPMETIAERKEGSSILSCFRIAFLVL